MNRKEMNWFERLMWIDKRVGTRHRAPPMVAYYWEGGRSEPHAVREASCSGLYLLTKERWYPGTIVTITLQRTKSSLKDAWIAITLRGRVVRSEDDGVAFAFELAADKRRREGDAPPLEADMKTVESFLQRAQSDVAQALIEYILLVPIVLLLVVNTVNVGGFMFAWITVANASRAAVNYAALGGASAGGVQSASTSQITAVATTELSSLPNNPSLVLDICKNRNGTVTTISGTCTSVPADSEPASYVLTSIDIYYTYKPFIPAGFQFKNLNVYVTIPPTTVHRRAVMRTLAMRMHFARRLTTDEGGSLIEFPLISVMFVLLLLGVVEVGRLMLVYTTMANAARAGARYAIVHGSDRTGSGVNGPSASGSATQVQTVVQDFASAGLLTVSNLVISVTYPDGTNTPGSRVSVRVTYAYDPLVSYFNKSLNVTLGSTSQGVITF